MALEHTPVFPISGLPEYAYVSALTTTFPDIADKAKDNLLETKNLIGLTMTKQGTEGAILKQLDDIIKAAKDAEIAFLTSHGFSNGGDNWSELIKGINEILGSKASFERAFNLLNQMISDDPDKPKEYKDINRFLIDYIQDEVYKAFEELSLNADLGTVAQLAIERGLKRLQNVSEKIIDGKVKTSNPKEGEEVLQAFQDLYNFTHLEENNPFFKDLKNLFRLEEYISKVQQQLRENIKVKVKDRLPINPVGGIKKYHGSLAEILDAAIAREAQGEGGNDTVHWKMTAKQVGGKNFKPDVIIADATIEYDYNAAAEQAVKELPKGTVRQQGIRTMEILFEQLKDAQGSMVILSNKNYLINEMFANGIGKRLPGFGAQTATNLNNLEALLSTVGMGEVSSLIDYFANAGDHMLLDLDENILRVIAARIANFLFDDMTITPPSGLNVVHVFNLSGIYVPLSFILHGVAAGLRNVESKMQNTAYADNFVNVNFKQGPVIPPIWYPKAWPDFRAARQKLTFIEVHFLQGFVEEITKAVSI